MTATGPKRGQFLGNRLALLAVASLLLTACGDTISGKAVAEPEVARFHERLKLRDFEGLYQATGADFRKAVPKAKAQALFAAIDRKLGPLLETKQINWSVNTHNFTTTVVLVYASRYQEGEATETFTFRVSDKTPELIGYDIFSLDMLIK
jgi:hypothetical protein